MPVGAEGVTRRTLTLFFLVDTSGSMYGPKIQAVNDAIENVLPIVHDISFNNGDAEIKVACMQFSYATSWMTEEPREADDFEYVEMGAEGLTSMGEAFKELETKLHQTNGGWMKNSLRLRYLELPQRTASACVVLHEWLHRPFVAQRTTHRWRAPTRCQYRHSQRFHRYKRNRTYRT